MKAPADVVRRRLLGRDGRHPTLSVTGADLADFSVVNDRPPELVAADVIARATG